MVLKPRGALVHYRSDGYVPTHPFGHPVNALKTPPKTNKQGAFGILKRKGELQLFSCKNITLNNLFTIIILFNFYYNCKQFQAVAALEIFCGGHRGGKMQF